MLDIETPRLTIRNFHSSDAADLRQMILKYQESPLHVYDHPWPTSKQEIQGATDWFAAGDQFMAICLKETGQVIGLVSLSKADNPARVEYEIGYVFNADFHGMGYATESCRALIHHAFTTWHAQRLVAGTAALNTPSRRLLEQLGFKKVSESFECFQSAPDGTPIEFLGFYFELTREEWVEAQQR